MLESKNANMCQKSNVRIWYKEPWPWFIITILVVSFGWGLFQLSVAFNHADDVVIDDYYIEGKMVNLSLRRDEQAKLKQISAELTFDNETGELLVDLSGKLTKWPKQLKLSFLSATIKDNDMVIVLNKIPAGHYSGFIDHSLSGSYYVQLEPVVTLRNPAVEVPSEHIGQEMESWRLNSKFFLSDDRSNYHIVAD